MINIRHIDELHRLKNILICNKNFNFLYIIYMFQYKLNNVIQKNLKYCLNFKKQNFIDEKVHDEWVKIINTYKMDYVNQLIIYNKFIKISEKRNLKIENICTENIYIKNINIIIITTGQSNAGGWGTTYNPKIDIDQPNENIFAYNIDEKKWVIADLSNGSLGGNKQNRLINQNLLGFQFAQHLVKNNPFMKIGIITYVINNKPISNWVHYDTDNKYYEENNRLVNCVPKKVEQGYYYKLIEEIYEEAINELKNKDNLMNIVVWHQGETDMINNSKLEYYEDALKKLVSQFKDLTNNRLLGFIGGTILNNKNNKYNSDGINSIIRKDIDNLYSYAELSNLERGDELHFTSESTRIGGKLYYEAYNNLMNKLSKEGIKN